MLTEQWETREEIAERTGSPLAEVMAAIKAGIWAHAVVARFPTEDRVEFRLK